MELQVTPKVSSDNKLFLSFTTLSHESGGYIDTINQLQMPKAKTIKNPFLSMRIFF